MSKPLITIVMATYNQGRYLRQALDSLRAQMLPHDDVEVIVINDGSTDETSEILRDYGGGVHLIERENRGLVASCNEGLALARGGYFARLDSDDFVAPEWLKCLVEALESNPHACCAYPDRYEVRSDQWRYVKAEPGNLYSLEACGTLFRTDVLRGVGGFRPFYWEEYDLYLRLRQVGKFVHVPQPLYMYRKHIDSMTHNGSKRLEGWLQLAKEWGSDTLKSVGFNPDLYKALQLQEKENKSQ
jgi:glycosyltransferase involved in cell wall biosynthesis